MNPPAPFTRILFKMSPQIFPRGEFIVTTQQNPAQWSGFHLVFDFSGCLYQNIVYRSVARRLGRKPTKQGLKDEK